MSKHIARQSVGRTFKQQLVGNYLLRREHERFEKYSQQLEIALEEGDLAEVARLENKIQSLILV